MNNNTFNIQAVLHRQIQNPLCRTNLQDFYKDPLGQNVDILHGSLLYLSTNLYYNFSQNINYYNFLQELNMNNATGKQGTQQSS